MKSHGTLIGRIARTLEDLETLVARVETFVDKARVSNDEANLHAAALDLHGYYTGAEQAFEAIA